MAFKCKFLVLITTTIEFSIDVQMQYLTKFIGLANKCFHLDFYFCLTS